MKYKYYFIISLFVISVGLASCVRYKSPAPVLNLGLNLDSRTGAMMVNLGDTLWGISSRYKVSMSDIIALNNLAYPYSIGKGQRLKLPPPVNYTIKRGDTLYSISRMFNVSVYKIVRFNDFKAPYRIRVGQMIKIPSSIARQKTIAKKKALKRSKTRVASSRKVTRKTSNVNRPEPVRVTGGGRPNFIWPVKGKVISNYGAKKGGLYNDGINIGAPKRTPVVAAASGVIVYVGDDLKSYGNLILIKHSGGMTTAYAHLSSVSVKKGMEVKRNQVIGTVGSTGSVSSSQLHFEVRKGAKTYNPKKYL